MQELGKILIFGGVVLIAIGLILFFFWDRLSWVGNLPGDIKIEGKNYRFYAPLLSMLLLSILLSLILWIIRRFF